MGFATRMRRAARMGGAIMGRKSIKRRKRSKRRKRRAARA
jgi:hypothetical protein